METDREKDRQREFDVVLHGASGFVGRLTAQQLAERAGGARIALSGRSREKVEAVRDALGVDWPVLVADSADETSLRQLAARTRVVASTVGPYGRHGVPLVAACAGAGTDYCDLTAEASFVLDSIGANDAEARRTGARIVHSAGFDSVPSDLAVLLLAERAAADGAGGLTETALVLGDARGAFSGGTIDSGRAEFVRRRNDPALAERLDDPYCLSPDRAADPVGHDEGDQTGPRHDRFLGRWTAPFVLSPYNQRLVRRSWALGGHAYGTDFRYREVLGTGRGALGAAGAAALAGGQALLLAALAGGPTRFALDRLAPAPGSGPAERLLKNGYFRIRAHTITESGARYVADVGADRDPGYGATAVMLAESALSLALDGRRSPGGVTTPAVAMGGRLAQRLRERDFTLRVRSARLASRS